jgi:ferric-dicitrate binding protein FerR (iron transport regulator)
MKTDRNSQEQAEILAKYLTGEMSEAESHAFEEEISVTGEKLIRIEKLKKQWSAMKGYKETRLPDTRKAWDKLHDRLQGEHLIPAQPVTTRSWFKQPVVKIAAAILILAGIGAVVYLNMIRKPAEDMVRLNTGSGLNTLVKTLSDGSVIYISRQSLFSFPEEFSAGKRQVELQGEAFFDIAPNPGKPFIIETDEALIQVLGTAFNVKTSNGKGFELFVDRGTVKVTLKSDPSDSEMVGAGEMISEVNNSLVKSKHTMNEAAAWYKTRMLFKDEPLKHIIHVLNLNFNTNFVLADDKTGKHRLTVTFHNETAETMTELICVTLNLKSQTINGEIVLFENKEEAKQP